MRVKGTSNVFLKIEFEVKSVIKVRRRIPRSKFFQRHTYATAYAKVEKIFWTLESDGVVMILVSF